jgi:protein-S-isoprenylcysteine O-methyltransferase Ste14
VLEFLHLLAWCSCIFYATVPLFWILLHSRVAQWRGSARSAYRKLLPIWALSWAVLALLTFRWRELTLYANPWLWLPGTVLLAIGFNIYFVSARNFTMPQVSGLHELAPDNPGQRLVTTGIRARVRHPLYFAHLCEMLGWSLATGLAVAYALTLFALATGAVMIQMEEKELEERFGEQYRAYRREVPALFPRL